MGSFHCPMGAPFYDGDGCILCGLCIAATSEEMVKASENIRAYLRSQADRNSNFKKIAVCGKGGTGKSTIVTLVGEVLKDENYRVLVIDADESNPGLYRMLGFNKEPVPLNKLLNGFSIGEPELDIKWIAKDEITFQDIPSKYINERDGLKFVMVGKITDPFQGCACAMADVTRDFIGKLVLADNEIVLIDAEAGIESFGRGLERNVDTVLIVVEPSFESLALAEKISFMADGIGVWMVRAILNKVPNEEARRKIVEELALKNVSQIGTVHLDPKVTEAHFEGKALGDSKALGEVKDITRRLISEAR